MFGRLKIKEVEINLASAKSDTNLAVNRVHINTGEAGKHDFSLQELYKNTACFHNSLFYFISSNLRKKPLELCFTEMSFFYFSFFFPFPRLFSFLGHLLVLDRLLNVLLFLSYDLNKG